MIPRYSCARCRLSMLGLTRVFSLVSECDLPADSYAKIDRVVFRIKGSCR